ncbi:MAG TPA: aminotransferase class V-fold PLP-dependent enzyme [Anaerolineaceae bacterium]
MPENYYHSLGISKAINAAGTLTLLGGCRMRPEAAAAMAEAAQSFVDLDLLLEKSGERIAAMLGVEAALVTAGASAALVQSAAACIAGHDPALRDRLPASPPARSEIIIQRCHRNAYDNALPTAGAHLVEVGNAIRTHPWMLESAITENTAAIFFALHAEMLDASLSLDQSIQIAHTHNLPVIVDAAAELPPKSNLWMLSHRGADLVIFSGGKDIRGPQTSGLIVGRKDLVSAAHFNGAPHYGVGRPSKASKEIVIGFLASLEAYLAEDEAARFAYWRDTQADMIAELNRIPHLRAQVYTPTQPGIHPVDIPRVQLNLLPSAPLTLDALIHNLRAGTPQVIVDRRRDAIILNLQVLEPGEPEIVLRRIREEMQK